mgnify:CR=1 FL=1
MEKSKRLFITRYRNNIIIKKNSQMNSFFILYEKEILLANYKRNSKYKMKKSEVKNR